GPGPPGGPGRAAVAGGDDGGARRGNGAPAPPPAAGLGSGGLDAAGFAAEVGPPGEDVAGDRVGGEAELVQDFAAGGVVQELLRDGGLAHRHVDGGGAQRVAEQGADAAVDDAVLHDHDHGVPLGEFDEVAGDGHDPAGVDDRDGHALLLQRRGDLDGHAAEG